MTIEVADPQRWPARRWWIVIAIVFGTQLILILWLGRPERFRGRAKELVPQLEVVGPEAAGALAMSDPTLFALPHQQGFSGLAWLNVEYHPSSPRESAQLLPLDQQQLGYDFRNFMTTNHENGLPVIAQAEFEFRTPALVVSPAFPTQSTLRLTGALSSRRLATVPALPSWPSADILSNSVVQVLVAASGETLSATLLQPAGSGSSEADQQALREARRARFDRVDTPDPLNPLAGVALGQMVFQWHTVPLTATNSAAQAANAK
ncbi:MAG TPA: hypothetical protein VL793_08595 [Patescibacteria group bacterium]|jgi:hypothetical protein|nr:hypothetical protein [Patescibacteria group bacterium]